MTDRKVTEARAGNGPGWFIAGMLAVIIVGAGILFYGGYFDNQDTDITLSINMPDLTR